MFFGKNSSKNFLSTTELTPSDPYPIAFKGNFVQDAIHGDGILKFSDGLTIYGTFKDNQLKD
jgi:hypothetical protein